MVVTLDSQSCFSQTSWFQNHTISTLVIASLTAHLVLFHNLSLFQALFSRSHLHFTENVALLYVIHKNYHLRKNSWLWFLKLFFFLCKYMASLSCCSNLVFIFIQFQAFTIPRELRTLQSTVPHDALSKVSNLFTCEVMMTVKL